MNNLKVRPIMNSTEVITLSSHTDSTSCCTIRNWLLAWAFIRLVVSILWGGVIVIVTTMRVNKFFHSDDNDYPETEDYMWIGLVGSVVQQVEIGMLVTFIIAGFKKSATLYRVYYYYCILTLIIYILAVSFWFTLGYAVVHWCGKLYLTYHISDLMWIGVHDAIVFVALAAMVDIGLEIWLIYLIKKLIKKYNYNGDTTNGENV